MGASDDGGGRRQRGAYRWAVVCLGHPRRTLALFLLASAAWLLALPALRLETDGRDLFSPSHPAVRFQDEVDGAFSRSDFVVVAVEATGAYDVFQPAPLDAVLDLTETLAALPGVAGEQVRSLATEVSPERSGGLLHLAPPIAATVRDAADAAAVRAAARREPTFDGILVASDLRATAIYVPIDSDADRSAAYAAVRRAVEERWRRGGDALAAFRAHLIGPVAAEALLGDHVLRDLARLLPLSLAVVALTLGLWFRRAGVVAVGLGEGAAVVLWTLGLMSVTGVPISLVTVVMPVILITYCVADTIHLGQCFLARRRDRPDEEPRAAMAAALGEILRPVAFTSLTTAAGFLAFAVSPIPPLRDFGLFSAFGVLLALAVSVLVAPAALLATGLGRASHRHARLSARLERLTVAAARAPWTVVAGLVLATVALGAGALRLEIQDSWVRNFDPDSTLARSDRWFNRAFAGGNVINVVLEPAGGSAHEPAFLAELERLQRRLERRPEVGDTRSLADPLRSVARSLEGASRLPGSRGESEEWALLLRMAGGSHSLDPYLDAEGARANLWVFLDRADYRRTGAALSVIDGFDWRDGDGGAPAVRLAGDAYLGHLLVGSIARSQRNSALAALVVTFLAVLWMLRSFPRSLLAVLPVTLAVAWNFGFMGWVGLSLGIATSTFCAIAFGIGVDFALHWIARLELALGRGLGWEDALRFTGGRTGGAILSHGLVLLLGFGVLLLSAAPPNRHLALILCVNLAACLGTTLILLPAAATLMRRRLAAGPAPALAAPVRGTAP